MSEKLNKLLNEELDVSAKIKAFKAKKETLRS